MEPSPRALKIQTLILQRLADVGLEPVSEAVKVDPSTISRWKGKEIPQLAVMLATLGLKVVPIEFRCYLESEIEALFTLAKSHITKMQHASELQEDDE